MSHYFENDKNLKSQEIAFDVHLFGTSFRFVTNSGVFSKEYLDYGSYTLINNVVISNNVKSVIDMGCGYGPIGIILAKINPMIDFYLVDINERALELASKNKELNNTKNVFIKKSFLFENIKEKVDLILTNPPIRAGKKIVFQLYEEAYERLNENGSLYVVIQKKQGAPSSLEKLATLFKKVEVVIKNKGYWVLYCNK